MGSFIGRATILSWIRRARSSAAAVTAYGPGPPAGVAWPDAGETQLTLNEKPRVFGNGDGETRPPISPNRFHQAGVQKDDLACAEQLYALGALSMKLDCDVQTVSKWADRSYVTTGK